MDVLLSAALQEVAIEGTQGCTLPKLWALLQSAGTGAEMIANRRSKQLLWQELINVPGMLLLLQNSLDVTKTDPRVQSVEEAEKLGLHLVAPESLRESSLGMYDLRVCDARLSKEQRNVLECIAKSRSKGITQSQLAKEFKIPGNKMFYLVKMLEVRGLVVRQATLVRTVDGSAEGNRHVPIVATNLLHLTRYAKDLTLSSHQRFEIFSPPKDTTRDEPNSFREDLDEEGEGIASKEREFIIKDDLPAMQAVCQKLEETDGKVLVVSDLKTSLGYRLAVGHRTWRRLVKRLQDAGLVEILSAQIEHKVRACIRLVKSFDSKAFKSTNEETENDLPLKCAKRGQVTDLVTELPIDQQIYNLIDRSGLEGVQMIEVFNSLGLQNKRNYYRISTMLERHLLVSEAENHKRSTLYRLKTAKNVNGFAQPSAFESYDEPKGASYGNNDPPPNLGLDEDCEEITAPQSSAMNEGPVSYRRPRSSARRALQQARTAKGKTKEMELGQDDMDTGVEPLAEIEMKLEPSWNEQTAIVPISRPNHRNYALQAESPLPMSFIPREYKEIEIPTSNVTMSTTRAQREKRIMEKLQAEKFVLRVELHRWLEEVENRKNIMMDRKTLSRMLQGLQASGHCKCVMLSMPGLTNCGRQRTTEVVLLPSLAVDPDLLSKVHDQVRKFDMLSRGHGVSRVKAKDSVPILTGVPRMHTAHVKRITKFDKQSENGRSMQANGFIPAKMVRVRMLHYFLWGYVNSLPEDVRLLPDGSGTSGEMVGSCKIFALANSVQTMPLELFLQVVGSFHKIEDVTEWCKQGLCLRDLPKEDFSALLDSNATGRLSWLVDVLRRLKLVRLVMGCGPAAQLGQDDYAKSSLSAVLTYAMEREPYLEEPAPNPLPSMTLDTYDLSPRARHEFSIVNKDGLDAYWQNLEYFYSGAQPAVARCAFPGSNVPELFGLRSWASLKIMSVEQRKELLKRVGDGGIEKRRPWHECVTIAKELNLSLQQVLRVSYEKNRVYRLQTLQKAGYFPRKRNHALGDIGETPHVKAYKKQRRQHDGVDNEVLSENLHPDVIVIGDEKQPFQIEDDEDDDDDNEGFGLGQPMDDFSFVASVKPTRQRSRRFTWSEQLDRLLIIAYARQRAQLGALFHRVDWDLMAGLPAPARACCRRMAQLRLDLGVRKAVTSLCSLLTLRFLHHHHPHSSKSTAGKELALVPGTEVACMADTQIVGSDCGAIQNERPLVSYNAGHSNVQQNLEQGPICTNPGQEYDWDDMREPFLAAALDEIIRLRTVVKASASTRATASRSKLPKTPHAASLGVSNLEGARTVDNTVGSMLDESPLPSDGNISVNLEAVAAAGSSSSKPSTFAQLTSNRLGRFPQNATYPDETIQRSSAPVPGRSLTAAGPTRRVRKHARSTLRKAMGAQEVTNEQVVRNSVAVANAVELVKLVLLNSGDDEAQLSGILVEAVQQFKETEVFTAVKYLRERGFMVAGQAGQTFVLSPKFFHDCSVSRFPVETGDECAVTEQWFHAHMKEIEQDWVSFPSDPRSGQLSHLLGLVSTNEFLLTPSLPAEGLGELEEKDKGKRNLSTLELSGYVRNVKAKTASPIIPHWSTSRRERGFPGVEVSVIHSRRSLATVLDTVSRGAHHIDEHPHAELSNLELLTRIDDVPDPSGETGVHQNLDDGHNVRAMGETLMGTESVFTEPYSLPYFPYGGHDWGPHSKRNEQIPSASSGNSTRATPAATRKLSLDDCILHWCSDPINTSAGARKLLMPELLQATYFAVMQAGEEGLSLEKLQGYLQITGMDVQTELESLDGYVHALESFGLVKRVNAYDHVRIVETSQSARFYLRIPHNDGCESAQQSCSGDYLPLPDSGKQLILSTPRFSMGAAGQRNGVSETIARMSRFDHKFGVNSSGLASQHFTESSTTTSMISGDHRIISLRPENQDDNIEYVPIVPWLSQNGTINKPMLKGLIRRVMGIITIHPGISEDTLVDQINVLNPQSVRQLMQILEHDGNVVVRCLPGPVVAAPPRLLQNLVADQFTPRSTALVNHYFVNPLADQHL